MNTFAATQNVFLKQMNWVAKTAWRDKVEQKAERQAMSRKAYPTDINDTQWCILESMLFSILALIIALLEAVMAHRLPAFADTDTLGDFLQGE